MDLNGIGLLGLLVWSPDKAEEAQQTNKNGVSNQKILFFLI